LENTYKIVMQFYFILFYFIYLMYRSWFCKSYLTFTFDPEMLQRAVLCSRIGQILMLNMSSYE